MVATNPSETLHALTVDQNREILSLLASKPGGMTVLELAERLMMSSSLIRLIDRLRRCGLVYCLANRPPMGSRWTVSPKGIKALEFCRWLEESD